MSTIISASNELYNTSPFSYINGLAASWVSNTTLSIATGSCRDSTNTRDMTLDTATVLNFAVNGVNGLDTGTFAASKTYYLFLVNDQAGFNAPCVVASLSATAPLLPSSSTLRPSGYSSFRRIGTWTSDASVHLLLMTQVGAGSTREYFYDTIQIVLNGGTATSFTAVSLDGFVPAIVTPVTFQYVYTPSVAADIAQLRATGSAATTVTELKGSTNAVAIANQVKVMTGIASSVAKFDYLVQASGALTMYVYSFKDFL